MPASARTIVASNQGFDFQVLHSFERGEHPLRTMEIWEIQDMNGLTILSDPTPEEVPWAYQALNDYYLDWGSE